MTEYEAKLTHMNERREFLNELARKRTCQGQFDSGMLHLDHPLPGGGRVLEPSDNGAGAAAIREEIAPVPLWQRLWWNARKTLAPKHRAVLDALCEDQRPYVAARIAGVGKDLVYRCQREIFPVAFGACYRAYRRADIPPER